jgi:rod shape determining protein RodA
MLKRVLTHFQQFDWIVWATTLFLVCFGLAAIYSIALSREVPDFFNFKKQIFSLAIGIVLLIIFSSIDYKIFKNYYIIFYILSVLILVAVLVFGRTIRGTTGWFSYGGFSFQPVELVKLFLLIFLAKYFSDRSRELKRFRYVLASGIFTAILIVLVLLQPDLGSAIILFLAWFGLILIAGIKRSHLLLIVGLGILVMIVSWFFVLQPFQKDRVLTFIDPSRDALGRGYNLTQSIIAVGSGNILGRGLGFGSQSQLRFLPESQTDFIFAVIAEELGLLGVFFVFAFFVILFYKILRNAREINDDFGMFFSLGFLVIIFSQAVINIGMNIGLAPITGITLPFVSYGGSSLIVNLMAVGILESIFIRNRKAEII